MKKEEGEMEDGNEERREAKDKEKGKDIHIRMQSSKKSKER